MSKNFKYYCYPIAMSNDINQGETSDLCSNQLQSTAPLLGGVGGGQNSWKN